VLWEEGEETFQLEAFTQLLPLQFHIEHIPSTFHLTPYSAYIILYSISLPFFNIYSLPFSISQKYSSCCFCMLNISALSIASSGNTIKFLIKFCYRFETYELRRIIIKRNRKGSKSGGGIENKVDFILSFIVAIIIDSCW